MIEESVTENRYLTEQRNRNCIERSNTNSADGAASLERALGSSDHDGSLLDNLSGFFKQGDSGLGNGILKHMLGGKRGGVGSGGSPATAPGPGR